MRNFIGVLFIILGILNLFTINFVLWDTITDFAIGYLLLKGDDE